jgi:hypothetical protein
LTFVLASASVACGRLGFEQMALVSVDEDAGPNDSRGTGAAGPGDTNVSGGGSTSSADDEGVEASTSGSGDSSSTSPEGGVGANEGNTDDTTAADDDATADDTVRDTITDDSTTDDSASGADDSMSTDTDPGGPDLDAGAGSSTRDPQLDPADAGSSQHTDPGQDPPTMDAGGTGQDPDMGDPDAGEPMPDPPEAGTAVETLAEAGGDPIVEASLPQPEAGTDTCTNGELDPDETDIDCGGPCSTCDVDQGCAIDADCTSDLCMLDLCREPGTCNDQAINQDETDLNCGGSMCPQCPDDSTCERNADCMSGSCVSRLCQPVGTCNDSTQNQDETGQDCGGSTCQACGDGEGCQVGSDCQSGLCASGVCTTAGGSCSDTADCTCDSYGGHDYWFCNYASRGDEAPAACATAGMTLVRIDDVDENDWLVQTATNHGLYSIQDFVFIGATRLGENWVWPNGDAFWTGNSKGEPLNGLYNHWRVQAPRNSFDCSVLFDDGWWHDLNCATLVAFICETP